MNINGVHILGLEQVLKKVKIRCSLACASATLISRFVDRVGMRALSSNGTIPFNALVKVSNEMCVYVRNVD